MKLNDDRVSQFLLAAEGINVIFMAFFIVAYLGGLPGTAVLHSEPIFRIPLAILGPVLVFLIVIRALVIVVPKED